MPPFTTAKNNLSEGDIHRFAACFLHIENYLNLIDWDAAAADFDPKVKVASFKTQVGRAVKKVKELDADGGSGGEANGKPKSEAKGKGKGKAVTKRKAPSDEEGEEKAPKTKAKGGKGVKKARFAEEEEGEVNSHDVGGDDDDALGIKE